MGKSGSYNTEKRNKIMEYLINHKDENISVREIETYLEQEGIGANLTTIYRYLDRLVEEGCVLKHNDEGGSKSTFQYITPDGECCNHLHMICSRCGKIYHMDCEYMKELAIHIFEHHNFALDCKTSMLYGICNSCDNNNIEKSDRNEI